jgi:hypothetical protein
MFCRQCKDEYRPGFTRCADCDVDLVESLAEPASDSDANLQEVWAGDRQDLCVAICAQLRAADIPFKVIQNSVQVVKKLDQSFAIGVAASFCDQAKEIIDIGWGSPDVEADHDDVALPADDDPDLSAEENLADNWDPGNWFPEDATVEVWSENVEKNTWMIESCLRENHIHSRTDALDDGSRKIFVLPDDARRAREIVREVEDASPLK